MSAPPPRLRRGDTIGIVAPAGPVRTDSFRRGLACLGDAFALRLAPSVLAPHPDDAPGYLAASDEVRAAELMAMLADPDVRAVIFARGGYGVMRILPLLDPDVLRRDPKPIVGYSDATALLSWAHRAGVRGIHGPVIERMYDLPPSDLVQLIALLTEPVAPGPRAWSLAAHGRGVQRGALVACNLSLASFLVGTPWSLPLDGAIALFEEVGERPYAIDRYLTQLTLTGAFARTAGAVIGDFTRCADPGPSGDPALALAVVRERLAAARIPLAIGAPIGHGMRNEPVPFGAACELDLDRATFAILEPAVA